MNTFLIFFVLGIYWWYTNDKVKTFEIFLLIALEVITIQGIGNILI